MFFLLALLLGLLGAFPILFGKGEKNTKAVAVLGAIILYSLIGWFFLWSGMPNIASPLWGAYSVILLIWWIISLLITLRFNNFEKWSQAFWFPFILLVLYIGVAITGTEILNSSKYSSLIGKIDGKTKQHWSREIQPLDPTHIRLVPEELAISLAKTALSQNGNTLGSQYPLALDYITLQKIRDDYWYLIPLDYEGFTVWSKHNSIVPGYVKVSATDPYAKPILISNKKIKYTPEAYFGDNLDRHIYWKYIQYRLTDYSFEENDSNQVYWVITAMKPTISFWGNKIKGVILVNPETGEDEFLSMEKLQEKKYAWIDRVVPESIVSEYIDYWGTLKDGWWNEFWTHINLLKSETPTMNYSSDGKCIFVSPITSTSDKDESMTGLMYVNSKTGKFTYYTTSGGATEEALIKAVNSSISYKKYSASEQIVYENIYGEPSALVPVLGANGNYQGLCIVQIENKRLAFGTTPQEALVNYQEELMNTGGQINTDNSENIKEFTGNIDRMGWNISTNGKQYYIYFKNFKQSFMISSKIQSEVELTNVGDNVTVKYFDSQQSWIQTIYFKNNTLDLKISDNQKSVISQIDEKK